MGDVRRRTKTLYIERKYGGKEIFILSSGGEIEYREIPLISSLTVITAHPHPPS